MEVDVVVAGSGAGALTAAIVAAQSGLKVLVCEKTDRFGGTTALSMGGAWIVANKHQPSLGINDSRQAGETYLRSILGDRYEHEKIDAYLESGAEMVNYMESRTCMKWTGALIPDYYPAAPGASIGRAVLTQDYDGRALGKYLRQMRMPLRGFVLFGSLQIAMLEAGKFHSALHKLPSFFHVTRRMMAFCRDALLHGRGAHLANGGALVGRLLRSALDAGVELRRNAPVTELMVENGRVRGIVVGRDGDREAIRARRGVVLATGGFGASAKLRASHLPLPEAHLSVQPDGNCGDGVELGLAVGGTLAKGNSDNGLWTPVSILRHPDGRVDKFPHFGLDRGKPGSIITGQDGKRFANEAAPYQEFVRVMHERKMPVAYFIASQAFQRRYGMGLALPFPYPVNELIRKGYLIEANTLDELAEKLSILADTLKTTIAEFDRHAANGTDPEFGRGGNAYDHSQGDYTHEPNRNLAPVGRGPYVAVKLYPGSASTFLGLATNAHAQVLNENGDIIPGLFAVGLDQNSVFRGDYPSGGSGLGPTMTFGYIAGKTLAAP
jgi:succinate dehydrogenase/fumarate reductase flavoprotein subunit